MLVTQNASSTVGKPQSVSKAIFHSYPRKGAAGSARRGFPRAGGWGVGAGKKEFEGVGPLDCSPPARRRRAAGEGDGSDESLLSEETLAEAAWPRSQTADGGRTRRRRRV